MCGLFGTTIEGPPTPQVLAALRRCRDSLTHRGPDHQGDWHDARLYLGHTRLSIVDTSAAGHQPMLSDDGALVLTVNGEIYNYRALRSQLEGHVSFRSDSDSEVLLHGYRAWGMAGLLERLRGMFAFALFDSESQQLHLARDPIGIKPLYLWHVGAHLAWASELKALQALAQETALRLPPLESDHSALYDFLTYRYVPAPKSLYQNVTKLRPGTWVSFDLSSGQLRETRYWSLPPCETGAPVADDVLTPALAQAVDGHLQADVTVGALLSGGLDSSVVVSFAAEQMQNLATFSLGFGSARSELPLAREVAQRYNTEHHETQLDDADLQHGLARLRQWFDEPFVDTSAYPLHAVARLARNRVKVVLTGDGGDELFAGYPRYGDARLRCLTRASRGGAQALAQWRHRAPILDRPLRALERYGLLQGFDYYARVMGGMTRFEKTGYRRYWQLPDDYEDYWHYREHYDARLDPVSALRRLEFLTYLPDDLLVKVDRVTMALGLEARVPLLDQALVELVFSRPATQI
ncbi:MAG: asparagine synthase (glutamine-hydrolyzing), partial [Pseudomonadota bacterium]